MTHINSDPSLLDYTIEEQLLIAKTGNDDDCEDAIYTGPHFVAVIDGATSRTERRWGGKTGGRIAAELLCASFDQLPREASAYEAVDIFTDAVNTLYKHYGVLDVVRCDPVQRAVASFVAVSLWRKEIWFVGDCQCLLDNILACNHTHVKEVDDIIANARSLFLEAEIAQGKTIEALLQHDTGRDFVLPLIKQQMHFQNNPSTGQYWYAVLDGFSVPHEGICIQSLPVDIETIVLASDGYPYLKDSLAASEQVLEELLQDDPLLFRKYKSTKGLLKGAISFDDRAYVRLRVRQKT